MKQLTATQIHHAQRWTGSLTEACAILDMPFHRAWNYVSGKPISIRPTLTGPQAKVDNRTRSRIDKNHYTFAELFSLRLAETLLSTGLAGKTVQPLIDARWAKRWNTLSGNDKSDITILIVYGDIDAPTVMVFPLGKQRDFEIAFHAAREIGAAHSALSLRSIMLDVLRRIVSYQEHRYHIAKPADEIVKDAVSRGRRRSEGSRALRSDSLLIRYLPDV